MVAPHTMAHGMTTTQIIKSEASVLTTVLHGSGVLDRLSNASRASLSQLPPGSSCAG
jgi:hypothetical protein